MMASRISLLAIAALCLAAGMAVPLAPNPVEFIVVVVALGGGLVAVSRSRRPDVLTVEAPFLLLLFAVVEWRTRSLTVSTEQPVDTFVLFRIGLEGLAALLAGFSVLESARRPSPVPSVPLLLLGGFVAAGCISSVLAVSSALALFQIVQVALVIFVLIAALRAADDAPERLIRLVFCFLVVLLATVWLGVLVEPGRALAPVTDFVGGVHSPIKVRLQGVFPEANSDTVGAYGALLGLWSALLALNATDRRRKLVYGAISFFSIAALILSQYRTGYLMVAIGAMVALGFLLREKGAAILLTFCAAAAISIVLVFTSVADVAPVAQGLAYRGQNSKVASTGTGRTRWWSGSIKVWEESPLVGHGLVSASRYEVIGPSGGEVNQAHSTWFEALAGTGAIGTACLAAAFLWTGRALFRRGNLIPIVLWAQLAVASVLSSMLAIMGFGLLMFALLIAWTVVPSSARRWAQVEVGEQTAQSGSAFPEIGA
jgi:O-antigen ligase